MYFVFVGAGSLSPCSLVRLSELFCEWKYLEGIVRLGVEVKDREGNLVRSRTGCFSGML